MSGLCNVAMHLRTCTLSLVADRADAADRDEGAAGPHEHPLHRGRDADPDYLVNEMLSTLGDMESKGYYRRLASTVPKDIIFEALSLVQRAVHEGKIRKSRGALFVAIVKRTCTDRGTPLAFGQPVHASIPAR